MASGLTKERVRGRMQYDGGQRRPITAKRRTNWIDRCAASDARSGGYLAGLDAETKPQTEGGEDSGGGGSYEAPRAQSKAAESDFAVRSSSAWTAKANKRVRFRYGLNYLIDVEHAIIVDVEATPARTFDWWLRPRP
jgi:hypothetical protein